MEDKSVRRYLTQLRRALICPGRDRQRLMDQARGSISGFLEENPGAGYEDLAASFGPPRDFAGEMLEQLDPAAVECAQKRRATLRRGLAAGLMALLVVCAVLWSVKWHQAQEVIRGDFKVIYETPMVITEEDAQEDYDRSPSEAQSHAGG